MTSRSGVVVELWRAAAHDSVGGGGEAGQATLVDAGLATGISGGLLAEPLAIVGTSSGSGCCS